MAHTKEQRSQHPLCGANKKSGGTCRLFAGQNTDHRGYGTCWLHGGRTPTHKKNAVKLEAQARMVKLGEPLDSVTPVAALLGLLRSVAGEVEWLRTEIRQLDDLGTSQAAVLLRMWDESRDRLVRVSEAAVRAGAPAEEVRIQQDQAATLANMVQAAAREAGLTDRHVRALGAALNKVFAEYHDDPERVAAEDQRLAKLRAQIGEEDERRIAKAAAQRPPADLAYPPSEWTPSEDAA